MTQGGPVTATMIYVYYIYEQAFQYFKLGKASAAVVVFFALILALTALQWQVFRRRIHYTT
jgi:multiple sugar transport system permease protein